MFFLEICGVRVCVGFSRGIRSVRVNFLVEKDSEE